MDYNNIFSKKNLVNTGVFIISSFGLFKSYFLDKQISIIPSYWILIQFLLEIISWIGIIFSLRSFCWKIKREDLKKFIPIAIMFFSIVFIYTACRQIKDFLVIPMVGSEGSTLTKIIVFAISIPYALSQKKLANKVSFSTLGYLSILPLVGYFSIFAFLLMGNSKILSSNAFIAMLGNKIPVLSRFFSLIHIWPMAIYYILAEIFAVSVTMVYFWQFANHYLDKEERGRMYPSLMVVAQFAPFAVSKIQCGLGSLNFNNYSSVKVITPIILLFTLLIFIAKASFFKNNSFEEKQVEKEVEKQVVSKYLTNLAMISLSTFTLLTFFEPIVNFFIKIFSPLATKLCLLFSTFPFFLKVVFKVLWYIIGSFLLLLGIVRFLKIREMSKVMFDLGEKNLSFLFTTFLTIFYGFVTVFLEQFWKSTIVKELGKEGYRIFTGKYMLIQSRMSIILTVVGSNLILRYCSWQLSANITPLIVLIASISLFGAYLFNISLFGFSSLHLAMVSGSIIIGFFKSAKYALFDPTKEKYIASQTIEDKKEIKNAEGLTGRVGKSGGALIMSGVFMLFPKLNYLSIYLQLNLLLMLEYLLVNYLNFFDL